MPNCTAKFKESETLFGFTQQRQMRHWLSTQPQPIIGWEQWGHHSPKININAFIAALNCQLRALEEEEILRPGNIVVVAFTLNRLAKNITDLQAMIAADSSAHFILHEKHLPRLTTSQERGEPTGLFLHALLAADQHHVEHGARLVIAQRSLLPYRADVQRVMISAIR